MSKNWNFYEIEAGADDSRAMEADTISKNGRNPKSHKSRGNFKIFKYVLLIMAGLALCPISCKKDDDKSKPDGPGGGTDPGLYMGIVGFGNTVDDKIKSISLLNTNTSSSFKNFINDFEMEDNTALYHAVYRTIQLFDGATYPNDLERVAIVTFTDGRDNNSTNLNKEYDSKPSSDYGKDVKKLIDGHPIANKKIDAFSIGLTGKEIYSEEEKAEFSSVLDYLTGNNGWKAMVDNIDEVKEEFIKIANSLYKETSSQTIEFLTPRRGVEIKKYRFTFDGVQVADNSTYYIEGDWNRATNTLSNVVYSPGVSCDNGKTIQGVPNNEETKVTFSFINLKIEGSEVDKDKTNLFVYDTYWTLDSEFKPNNISDVNIERKSAIIMLVLDCTTSLGVSDFNSMKNIATNFIDILASDNPGGGGGGGGTTRPNPPTGINAWQDEYPSIVIAWNSVSSATSYDVYRSSSSYGTYYYQNSTSSTQLRDYEPFNGDNYYKVKAVNSAGESDFSDYAYAYYSGGGGSASAKVRFVKQYAAPVSISISNSNGTYNYGFDDPYDKITDYFDLPSVGYSEVSYSDAGLGVYYGYLYHDFKSGRKYTVDLDSTIVTDDGPF